MSSKKKDGRFGLVTLKMTKDDLEFLMHQLIKRKHSVSTRIIEGALSVESLQELGQEHTRLKSMLIHLEERK